MDENGWIDCKFLKEAFEGYVVGHCYLEFFTSIIMIYNKHWYLLEVSCRIILQWWWYDYYDETCSLWLLRPHVKGMFI